MQDKEEQGIEEQGKKNLESSVNKSDKGKEKPGKFLVGLFTGFLVSFLTWATLNNVNNAEVAMYIILLYLFSPVIVYLITKHKNITKGYTYSIFILIFLLFMIAGFTCAISGKH